MIDEADRMLDQGFEAEMKEIITLIPKGTQIVHFLVFFFSSIFLERQTMLFSATQTNKVQDLAKVSLTDPHEVCFISKFAEILTSDKYIRYM